MEEKMKSRKNNSTLSDTMPSGSSILPNRNEIICPKCGYKIQENWNICPICGETLKIK